MRMHTVHTCYGIARMTLIFYERGTLVCFVAENGGGQTFAEALFDLALHGGLGARPQICGWHQWPCGDAMWRFKRWLKTFHANVADSIWLILSLFASLFAAYWAIGVACQATSHFGAAGFWHELFCLTSSPVNFTLVACLSWPDAAHTVAWWAQQRWFLFCVRKLTWCLDFFLCTACLIRLNPVASSFCLAPDCAKCR